jgi:ankyrin repeat protein
VHASSYCTEVNKRARIAQMKAQLVCFFSKVGRAAELHWLLESGGCDPDARDDSGVSALSYASECGHAACVRELLHYGADENTQDKGATPLLLACMEGHLDVAEALLSIGAKRE